MKFEVKKVDNCFSDAQSYEYKVPVTGQQIIRHMSGWNIKENHKYRRAMFIGNRDGSHTKGVLKANVFRVSFRDDRWEWEKAEFEVWLGGLGTEEEI